MFSDDEIRETVRQVILSALSKKPIEEIGKKNRLSNELWRYLTEGIFKTYDIDFSVDYICRTLGFTKDIDKFKNFESDGYVMFNESYTSEKDSFSVIIPSSYKDFDKLYKVASLCGFYESDKRHIDKDKYLIQLDFEKNIQEEIRGVVGRSKYLYHLTPTVYLDDILTNGLKPLHRNKGFDYDSRVYFLLSKKYTDVSEVAQMLYNVMIEHCNNEKELENVKKYKSKFTLLRIETSKMIGKYKFYIDNNFENYVYIKGNVPPSLIEVDMSEINVKKII